MKAYALLSSSLVLAACSTTHTPKYYYSKIDVANKTGSDISNLSVQLGERELRCESVANKASCLEQSSPQLYPNQPMQLSWRDSNGQQQSKELDAKVPASLTSARPFKVLVDIREDGSLKIMFHQTSGKD